MKKASLTSLFIVILIDLIGFGIVLPLIPFFAKEFHASSFSIGILFSIFSLAQILFSPFWGSLSDRFGRRPIMMISTFGNMISYLIFSYAQSFELLFFSRFLAGMMGGNISTAQAYIADTTSDKERTKGMGIIGAAFGIGFVIGPALSTILIHPNILNWVDITWNIQPKLYFLPGIVATCLSLFSFLLVCFYLPEPNKQNTSENNFSRFHIFNLQFWKELKNLNNNSQKTNLSQYLTSLFLITFGQATLYSAFPLFCQAKLRLEPQHVGSLYIYMGLLAAIIQGGVIRYLLKKHSETKLFFYGSIFISLGLGFIALSTNIWTLIFYLSIMTIGGSLTGPSLNSLVSQQSNPSQFGMIMGITGSITAFGRMLGPSWGGLLFGWSPLSPFILTALLLSLTIFIAKNAK